MEKKSYTVAIDLGSSNVVVAVGSKREDGTLGIEAVVSKPVEGVKAGRIDNIEQAGNAIREAVAEVESTLGVRITEAYAGISGEFVRCARPTAVALCSCCGGVSALVPAIPTTSLPTIPRTG